jgi:hypothetical protein
MAYGGALFLSFLPIAWLAWPFLLSSVGLAMSPRLVACSWPLAFFCRCVPGVAGGSRQRVGAEQAKTDGREDGKMRVSVTERDL